MQLISTNKSSVFFKNKVFPILFSSLVVLGFSRQSIADESLAKLPKMGADLTQTSVSGLSSGGFMTAQLDTAFSKSFVGAGIIAAGPYYCAGNLHSGGVKVANWKRATTTCMDPLKGSEPDPKKLLDKAKEFAKQGLIDDVQNLKNQNIYIFSGTKDSTVRQAVVDQTKKYYELAGVSDKQLQYVNNINAGHAIITNVKSDLACDITKSPYINNCGQEQSHELLKHIYKNLNEPQMGKLSGEFMIFDQREFITPTSSSNPDVKYLSMSERAVAYIPTACKTNACKVHIAIHGCGQGIDIIGDKYYTTTGYAEMADTNNMIVLFPQVKSIMSTTLQNPEGCWDFWGYTGDKFYSKDAPQMKTIMAMLQRLGEAK